MNTAKSKILFNTKKIIMCIFFAELDKAIESFKHLLSVDPYRLDNLDTYSNLLYVKDLKTDLANLAHHAVAIDKYKVETCCVIGKYTVSQPRGYGFCPV